MMMERAEDSFPGVSRASHILETRRRGLSFPAL